MKCFFEYLFASYAINGSCMRAVPRQYLIYINSKIGALTVIFSSLGNCPEATRERSNEAGACKAEKNRATTKRGKRAENASRSYLRAT